MSVGVFRKAATEVDRASSRGALVRMTTGKIKICHKSGGERLAPHVREERVRDGRCRMFTCCTSPRPSTGKVRDLLEPDTQRGTDESWTPGLDLPATEQPHGVAAGSFLFCFIT